MRKLHLWVCFFAMLAWLPLSAFSEGSYYGTVVCENPVTVRAPFGGTVTGIQVSPGSRVAEKTKICTIETTKVYAPADGTVSGVFIRPGDSVESIKTIYTNLVYITPAEKFTVNASVQNASKKSPEFYPSVGQTVYLESGAGRTLRTGTGYIASITPANAELETPMGYAVRITEGEYFQDDKVNIYWAETREKKTAMGSGTVDQTPAITIAGEGGSILRVHVKPGDTVHRGDLLYETVTGDLNGLKAPSDEISAGTDGIVASSDMTDGATVEKGAALLTLYPVSRLQVCVKVSETELKNFIIGDSVDLFFSREGETAEGRIASVSYLAEATESTSRSAYANYKVYIDFDADDSVRLGMLVAVEIP